MAELERDQSRNWKVEDDHVSRYPVEIMQSDPRRRRAAAFCLALLTRGKKVMTRPVLFFLGLILLVAGIVLFQTSWLDPSVFEDIMDSWSGSSTRSPLSEKINGRALPRSPFPCPTTNTTLSCRPPSSPDLPPIATGPPPSCPDYFRWIHEDLRPWKKTGITRRMVERAGKTANFRLVLLKGRLYVESYAKSIQTRDVFSWWGFVQFVRKFSGRLPDLDLMFDCDDLPVVKMAEFPAGGKEAPPPLFRYCKDSSTLDILFPDWSFWGWSEINIKPWVPLARELKEGNGRRRWIDREPYAFWKGNPTTTPERGDLLKCNVSQEHDWNARFFTQDWMGEGNQGFQHSNLADQCTYRYKVYVEGWAWSVSQKYILACDSPALLVTPTYHEFFTRGLYPLKHYWPIRKETKCSSIKFAVDWGNTNKDKAQVIGGNASKFIMEELKMDYVYDYMFHLLTEYAKLLRYTPRVPRNAAEVCQDSMLCSAEGRDKTFMTDSRVDASRASTPCSLPSPFTAEEIESISRTRAEALKSVQVWESNYNLSSTF